MMKDKDIADANKQRIKEALRNIQREARAIRDCALHLNRLNAEE